MAKYKKKKSAPTPNTAKSDDVPETEPVEPIADKAPEAKSPPKKPEKTMSDAETAEYKAKLDKLFWLRVGLGVIAGVVATFAFEPLEGEDRRWASIGFMIMLFLITIGIAKNMKMQLPSSDRKKIVTQGIGSYVFLYLFMWIVSYTLVNLSVTDGVPSPIP